MSRDRQRRSAKTVINDMANEMLNRTTDPDLQIKLNLLQTICAKMGWNDLFEKLRNRHRHVKVLNGLGGTGQIEIVEQITPEKWWQK